MLVQKNYFGQKNNFGPKKFYSEKYPPTNIFASKKFWKTFWSKNVFGPKFFGPKKILVQNIFRSNKNFGSEKDFWFQKNF